jgi:hypothetical protein
MADSGGGGARAGRFGTPVRGNSEGRRGGRGRGETGGLKSRGGGKLRDIDSDRWTPPVRTDEKTWQKQFLL